MTRTDAIARINSSLASGRTMSLEDAEAITKAFLEERILVTATIRNHLAHYPGSKPPKRRLKLTVDPVTNTAYVILQDFDSDEPRIHFVSHKGASLKGLDPKSGEW